jgi:hypothetical protein
MPVHEAAQVLIIEDERHGRREKDRAEQNKRVQSGTEQDRIEKYRTGQNREVRNRTEEYRT